MKCYNPIQLYALRKVLLHMLQTGCHHVTFCIIRRLHDYMWLRVHKHWRPYTTYVVLVCWVMSYLMLADMMFSIMFLLNTCICIETPWMSCKRLIDKGYLCKHTVLCECNSLENGIFIVLCWRCSTFRSLSCLVFNYISWKSSPS